MHELKNDRAFGVRNRYFRRTIMAGALLCGTSILPTAAVARQPVPSEDPRDRQPGPPSDAEGRRPPPPESGEIIVTAQRRAESQQRAAVAVSVVGGREINEKARATVAEALASVPSVHIQATPQGGQVFIRGVGANGDSNFIDSAVSLMVDGVYSGRSEALGGGLYDVERIEILRGPQGTLYGRNATGGVINVLTKAPAPVLGAELNGRMGNYGLVHVDGAVNVPVSDNFAVRIAGLREHRNGYFSNGGRESDQSGLRGRFRWTPSSAISVLGTVDWFHSKGFGNTTVPAPGSLRTTVPDVLDSRWDVDVYHPADQQDNKFLTASLQIDADVGFGTLTLIPAFTKSDRYINTNLISGIELNPFTGQASTLMADTLKEKQYTGEVRLASKPSSPIVWVVGLYGLHSINGTITTEGTNLSTGYNSFQDSGPTTSYAAFGQATVPLSDRLRATAGLRYTKDRKERSYGFTAIPVTGYPQFSSGPDTLVDKYNALTYRAGLEFDVAPQSLLYGNIATGYKAGGFGTTTFPPVTYEPEKLTAFEIGSKNRFLDHRLTLNLAAYYYRYKNYQTQYAVFGGPLAQNNLLISYLQQQGYTQAQIDAYIAAYTAQYLSAPGSPPFSVNQFSQYVANADTGTNYGAELELRYTPTQLDEIGISYSYTDARYGDFDATITPSLTTLNGARVANTPLHSALVSYQHRFRFAGGDLSARGEVRLSSGYWATVADRQFAGSYQGGYHVSSAFLTYSPANQRFTATAWVKNIEGKAQVTYVFPMDRQIISDPRTFGLNLSARF